MAKRTYRPRQTPSVHYSDSDRITDLPSNVLDNILVRLPIRDAVRTSILSKKWRYKWSDIPHLEFDSTFRRTRQALNSEYNKLLLTTIYEVLLLHSGPIQKFTLSFPALKSCPEIDRLILFLSRKDVQDFKLCLSNGNRHKLPSHLFSCSQLKCLNLCSCIFIPPPSFKGFSRLVSLKLQEVQFPSDFKNFISNFPSLEELMLQRCTDVSCLEINSPNLKVLYYNGSYNSVCFKNVPCLAVVSIYKDAIQNPASKTGKIPDLDQVLRSLPGLRNLSVDYDFLKTFVVRDALKRLPTPLKHLNIIRLFYLSFDEPEEISNALFLLRNSPNLQKLQIEVYEKEDTESLELLDAQEWYQFSLNQLEEVKIQKFNGSRPEVEFVKFLLAKSPALRTMRVQPCEEMSSEEQLTILKEIIRFRRCSPNAEIICEDFVEEYDEDVVTI